MITVILWKGISWQSMENCRIQSTDEAHDIRSVITGVQDERIFRIEYEIRTDRKWQTLFVKISTEIDGETLLTVLEKKNGHWYLNGKSAPEFEAAAFVDISLTPFTNTLPIKGVRWTKEPRTIDVIYFDMMAGEVKLVQQIYKALDESHYFFSTADGSFQETITVDSDGFVDDYPGLFKMIAKQKMPDKK
ncbi:MAG TPA: putative glycolipid-binding domain-containing protein [Puia sp.]|nr:putative glycolipid-binding domain-containing protein [Puia sp.]